MDRIENIEFCIRYLLEIEKTKLGIETGIPHDLRGKQRLLRALMNIWEPQPLSEEYLRAQDAELQAQIQDKGVVTLEDITASVPRSVLLWQGDITRLRVDAIVNAANSQMMGCWYPLHTCIDNCIHSAAGLQLRAECAEAMSSAECPSVHPEYTRNNTTYRQAFTSETLITEAYNLPCQYVIHTVGPIILDGVPTKEQEEQLYSCYRNCLETAKEYKCRSIAFCCISTGEFHFPNRRAAEIAIEAVKSCELKDKSFTVVFNVFKDIDYDIYRELLSAY